jgi:hypothetical protein
MELLRIPLAKPIPPKRPCAQPGYRLESRPRQAENDRRNPLPWGCAHSSVGCLPLKQRGVDLYPESSAVPGEPEAAVRTRARGAALHLLGQIQVAKATVGLAWVPTRLPSQRTGTVVGVRTLGDARSVARL